MKKTLGLILAVLMLFAALPVAAMRAEADTDGTQSVTASEQKGTIVNCKEWVNVREEASSKSRLLGKANKGETYTVLGKSGDWVKIDFDGEDGYVYKSYIRVKGTPVDTPVEGKTAKIVNCKKMVNVRSEASSNSRLLGTAKKGETFKVLATAGDWVKIVYQEDKAGYVFSTYVKITDEGGEEPTEGKVGKIVNCRKMANVRAKATSNSKLLGTVKKGETYKVLGKSGDWVKIAYHGKEGYVFKRYIRITEPEEPIEGKTGTIVNCNEWVNVRAKATKDSKLLGRANKGETFTVRGKSGNWIKIDFNGKTGYVYKTYIRIG